MNEEYYLYRLGEYLLNCSQRFISRWEMCEIYFPFYNFLEILQ